MSVDKFSGMSSGNREDRNIHQVQPVDFKTDQEIADLQKNRILIHQESGLTKSITDSYVDNKSRGDLNLTEYERQVRRANGLPSQLEPSNGGNNEQQIEDENLMHGFPSHFGSLDKDEEKRSGGPGTWSRDHGQPRISEVENGQTLIRKCSDYQRQLTRVQKPGDGKDLLGLSEEFLVET